MRKRIIPGLVAVALLASVGGCRTAPGEAAVPGGFPDASAVDVRVGPGEEFVLPVGGTALVEGAGLAVTFGRVLEDSRCPSGTTCVRAGNARVGLVLQKRGHATDTVELGTDDPPRAVSYAGYTVALRGLDPLPAPGEEPAAYTVRLVVSPA